MNNAMSTSYVRVDMQWDQNYQGIARARGVPAAPTCDADVTIEVGTVIQGRAVASSPLHTIQCGETPGYIEVFGN